MSRTGRKEKSPGDGVKIGPRLWLRDARREDLPYVVAVFNSAVGSGLATAETSPITVDDRVQWFLAHDARRPLWVVVDHRAQVIGWLGFQDYDHRPSYNGTAELSVYLSTNARGRGVGGLLVDWAVAHAPALGIDRLIACVFHVNEPSIGLFTSRGFDVWGRLPGVVRIGDGRIDLVILGRTIEQGPGDDPHCRVPRPSPSGHPDASS